MSLENCIELIFLGMSLLCERWALDVYWHGGRQCDLGSYVGHWVKHQIEVSDT